MPAGSFFSSRAEREGGSGRVVCAGGGGCCCSGGGWLRRPGVRFMLVKDICSFALSSSLSLEFGVI